MMMMMMIIIIIIIIIIIVRLLYHFALSTNYGKYGANAVLQDTTIGW